MVQLRFSENAENAEPRFRRVRFNRPAVRGFTNRVERPKLELCVSGGRPKLAAPEDAQSAAGLINRQACTCCQLAGRISAIGRIDRALHVRAVNSSDRGAPLVTPRPGPSVRGIDATKAAVPLPSKLYRFGFAATQRCGRQTATPMGDNPLAADGGELVGRINGNCDGHKLAHKVSGGQKLAGLCGDFAAGDGFVNWSKARVMVQPMARPSKKLWHSPGVRHSPKAWAPGPTDW